MNLGRRRPLEGVSIQGPLTSTTSGVSLGAVVGYILLVFPVDPSSSPLTPADDQAIAVQEG